MEEHQITEAQHRKLCYELTRWSIKGNPEELTKLDKFTASNVIESLVNAEIDSALGQLKHLGVDVEATEETYL